MKIRRKRKNKKQNRNLNYEILVMKKSIIMNIEHIRNYLIYDIENIIPDIKHINMENKIPIYSEQKPRQHNYDKTTTLNSIGKRVY